jgi:hypothetical protein
MVSPALLLAAFGVPQTLEQQPQRAVQAAPGEVLLSPAMGAAGRGLVPGAAARNLAPRRAYASD